MLLFPVYAMLVNSFISIIVVSCITTITTKHVFNLFKILEGYTGFSKARCHSN